MSVNDYSPTWFETFLDPIDAAQTRREAAFVGQVAPPGEFPKLLDVCCGPGRHAGEFVVLGYDVTGIDRDAAAIETARQRCPQARFIEADFRALRAAFSGPFDVAVMLWQSFGYFDRGENLELLIWLRNLLLPGGRLVLDVYDRRFFATRLQPRTFTRGALTIVETKSMEADRLRIRLDYGDGRFDAFDWQVFSPNELVAFAAEAGLTEVSRCSEFDPRLEPSEARPRMQVVFQAPITFR